MGLDSDGVPSTMLQRMSKAEATPLLAAAKKHGVPRTTLSTLFGVAELERQFEEAQPGNVLTFEPVWAFVANEIARTALVKRHGHDVIADSVMRVRTARALAGEAPLSHLPACDLFNISCDIKRVFDEHLPLLDGDNDYFASGLYQLRGASWRGKDCNDKDATIYPGRALSNHGPAVDHNCNGIYGVNATGGSYEQLFCSGANQPMGVGILGDSATAHFHIPPQLLNARDVLHIEAALDHIIALGTNEADWPQCSWSTAFRGSAQCPSTPSDVSLESYPSIYQRMLAKNKCAHRDLQNTGVNGARVGSESSADGIMYSLARNQTTDHPMLLFWALIGNDVCNGHPGSEHMTTVPEFRASVLKGLSYLDTVLPAGSHVAFMPLVDGRVLWDHMHDRIHPIGVPYPAVYDLLSCVGSNPCWGWLNSNETWRNFTSERAANLSAVYTEIQGQYTWKNFDTYVLTLDWNNLFASYEAAGGQGWELIEPVDGFHPSQAGHELLAAEVWWDIGNHTAWIPKENPFNAAITAQFGDQGGY